MVSVKNNLTSFLIGLNIDNFVILGMKTCSQTHNCEQSGQISDFSISGTCISGLIKVMLPFEYWMIHVLVKFEC